MNNINEQFTKEELKIIFTLIQRTNLNGSEATRVAVLIQKINTLIAAPVEEPKKAEGPKEEEVPEPKK